MLHIVLRSFWGLCRRSISYFVLTLTCLICIFVSLLFLQERGYYSYIESISTHADGQLLYFACDDGETLNKIYEELFLNSAIPSIEVVTVSNGQYAGVFWNREVNDIVWYTPYGHFFTQNDMDSGNNVALLATSYIERLSPEKVDSIWDDGIEINGIFFKAIGNYFFELANNIPEEVYQSEVLSASVTLPLKTFLYLGMKATRFRCVFAEALNEIQVENVRNIVQQYGNVYNVILPSANHRKAIDSFINSVVPSSLIVILAMISLVDVIVNWIKKDHERYKAYLLCGAKETQITGFILINVAILTTISYIGASIITSIITNFTPREILLPLPLLFQIIVYLGILFITLIIALIKSYRFVFSRQIINL